MVTDSRFLTAHGLTAASGRLDLLDNSWDGQVVVVGATAAESLGVTVGLGAGVAASIIPAVHAARRDPAGVLRAV
nr:hypothetical protein [Propionicimonas sp.]